MGDPEKVSPEVSRTCGMESNRLAPVLFLSRAAVIILLILYAAALAVSIRLVDAGSS
jgi:hypothetical protein